MIIFYSWLDYLIAILLFIIMVQVGMIIGASLERRYGS